MKFIAGIITLITGLGVGIYGLEKTNIFFAGVGAIVLYTGYRVLKSNRK